MLLEKSKSKTSRTYSTYQEAVDIAKRQALVFCKICGKEYEHPRAKPDGSTSTLVKHANRHNKSSVLTDSDGVPTQNIQQLLEIGGRQRKFRIQDEFEEICLRAMVACNWAFSQFSIEPFRTLLSEGYADMNIPSPKVMRGRLFKYASQATLEIKSRLVVNTSHINLVLDCWTSSNHLEFIGTAFLISSPL